MKIFKNIIFGLLILLISKIVFNFFFSPQKSNINHTIRDSRLWEEKQLIKKKSYIADLDSLSIALKKDSSVLINDCLLNKDSAFLYVILRPIGHYVNYNVYAMYCRRHELAYVSNISMFIFTDPFTSDSLKKVGYTIPVKFAIARMESLYYDDISKLYHFSIIDN